MILLVVLPSTVLAGAVDDQEINTNAVEAGVQSVHLSEHLEWAADTILLDRAENNAVLVVQGVEAGALLNGPSREMSVMIRQRTGLVARITYPS